jgi:hypothetical protein
MILSKALIALPDFPNLKAIWLRPKNLEVVGNDIGVQLDIVGHIGTPFTPYPRVIATPNFP